MQIMLDLYMFFVLYLGEMRIEQHNITFKHRFQGRAGVRMAR
jgi:hypothetical protein